MKLFLSYLGPIKIQAPNIYLFISLNQGSTDMVRFMVAVLFLIPSVVNAQSTWNDLSFGMSADEVRNVLASHQLKLNPTPGDKFSHATAEPYDLTLTGGVFTQASFRVLLDIGPNGLSHIRLILLKAYGLGGKSLEDGLMKKKFFTEQIQTLLASRYGQPISQTGDCITDTRYFANSGQSCEVVWSKGGQQITGAWFWSVNTFVYQIDYQRVSSGL